MQAQLAAFLLGDSNASSTAMRSAAQLVQLLDPPPPLAAQALTQCPPALPPAQPRSGHASMPLPVTQVRSPRHPPKREGTTGCEWGDAFDVDTTEAISGLPDSLCSELSCLLRAHPPIHATGK